MGHSVKYDFFMSQLTEIEVLKETSKTKICVVYHGDLKASCILRVCKNRDLSLVCEALRKIRNPNTVVVYDFVYENGDTYILEENVDGVTIEELMENEGLFSEARTATIIVEICKALEQLHREKPPVVHNDINPSNIKIREDGSIKLFDFDISRIYKKGQNQNTMLFGTEEYASPEHFGYGQSEPRTDIYCLGVTMHKMLTGQGLSNEHRITYSGKLKNILAKCLEFDPRNRYNSVLLLRKDLEKFLTKGKRIFYKVCSVLCVVFIAFCVLFALKHLDLQNKHNDETPIMNDTTSSVETTNGNTNVGFTEEENTSVGEATDSTEPALNDSKENAWNIPFEQKQTGVFDETPTKWYKFVTDSKNAIYRISLCPIDAPRNMMFPFISVALYDAVGIKVADFDVWSDDKDDFLDIYLDESSEYFVKISLGGRFNTGKYEMSISKRVCDAGTNKDTATIITLGEQHSATIDSTLSDWHVFRVPKTGDYIYTIHNISVGCSLKFSKQQPGSAGEGMSVENEDNFSGTIRNVQEGEFVYFEISPYNSDPKANGKYIIVIEETKK